MLFSHFKSVLHPSKCLKPVHDLGLIPSEWVLRTGETAHLIIGHQQWPCASHSPCFSQNLCFISSCHFCCFISATSNLHKLFSPQGQISLEHTLGVPILPHYLPSTPRYLSKDSPINGFAFSFRQRNPPQFSQPLPMYRMGTLSPSVQGFCLGRTRVVSRSPGVNQPSSCCYICIPVLSCPIT